jgi:hypothetical protein
MAGITLAILLILEAASIAYSMHTAPDIDEEEFSIISDDNIKT